VATNTNGKTAQSTEKCQLTGSSGSNTNSITVTWARQQGAISYQVCEGTTGAELLAYTVPGPSNPDFISWIDTGVTSSGSCSTTNTSQPGLDQWAFVNLLNQSSGFAGKLIPTTLTANRTYTLPDATGTVALTSNIPAAIPIRAGPWTITASTSAAVTFGAAMSSTPTSCSVTPSASAATTGTPFVTALATTGFTVNVPTSGTLSGTYLCALNNAN
jgi:hypothetical protein